MARADFRPAQNLRFGGSGKPACEPFDDEGIEAGKNIWRNRGNSFNHLTISLTYFRTELRGTVWRLFGLRRWIEAPVRDALAYFRSFFARS